MSVYRRQACNQKKCKLLPLMHSIARTTLATVSLCTALWGCVDTPHDDLSASSAITFSAPGFHLSPGSRLKWRSGLVYLFDDPRDRPDQFRPFLQQEIQSYLESRGHVFTTDVEAADYGLVAVAVMGTDMTAATVLQEFRLTPSFPASRRYPRGTIVIALYSTGDERVQWRGAIQGNIDLDEPEEMRRQRVRKQAEKLLKMIPETKE